MVLKAIWIQDVDIMYGAYISHKLTDFYAVPFCLSTEQRLETFPLICEFLFLYFFIWGEMKETEPCYVILNGLPSLCSLDLTQTHRNLPASTL